MTECQWCKPRNMLKYCLGSFTGEGLKKFEASLGLACEGCCRSFGNTAMLATMMGREAARTLDKLFFEMMEDK